MEWLIGTRKKEKRKENDEVKETKPYLEKRVFDSFITSKEEIREIVVQPTGIELNEWLATHTLTLFNSTNEIYGAVTEFCTAATCPTMTAGSVVYNWYGRKAKISSPQYIDLVMTHIQKHVEDETCLPSKYGSTFPASFSTTIKKFIKLLFHVIGHLYYSHIEDIVGLELQPHLNTIFIHLMYFDSRFSLLEARDTVPLDDLAQAMNLNLESKQS